MRVLGIIIAGSLAIASAALAQQGQPVSSLKGHDTSAPIDWAADRIEVQAESHRVFLTGSVTATQAELILHAPRVTVAYDTKGGLTVHYISATGGVRVNTPTEEATGDIAIYDLDSELITIIGNVQLKQRSGLIRGRRLVIDLTTGRASLSGGRVTGTFTPGEQAP